MGNQQKLSSKDSYRLHLKFRKTKIGKIIGGRRTCEGKRTGNRKCQD